MSSAVPPAGRHLPDSMAEHIRGGRLAHLEDQAIWQQSRGGGAEVGVTGIVVGPELRGEGVKQLHGRRASARCRSGRRRPMNCGLRCSPWPPIRCPGIDGGSGRPIHTAPGCRPAGRPPCRWMGPAVPGCRHDQPVVGVTVSRITPEADDHPAVGESQGDSLQLEGRVGAGRLDVLVYNTVPVTRPARWSRRAASLPAATVATTKISERAASITGVPVISTVESMSPQSPGTVEGSSGVPR